MVKDVSGLKWFQPSLINVVSFVPDVNIITLTLNKGKYKSTNQKVEIILTYNIHSHVFYWWASI